MARQVWKKQLIIALSGGFLMSQAVGVFAASPELSLDDSVAMALKNNPAIKMALDDKDKSLWGIKEMEAGKWPTVSLGSTGTRNQSSNSSSLPGNSFNTGLKLNWQLYSGGRVEGLVDQAKLNANIADFGVAKTQQQVRLDATTAYFNVLQARNTVKVGQDAVNSLSQHLKNVQAQYTAGVVAKADVLRSEVELANAQQNLTKAQNSYDLAAASLNNVIGLPLDTANTLKDDLSYIKYDVSLDDSIALALKNRPEIAQSQDGIDVAKIGVKIADSSKLPSVSFSAADSRSGSEFPGSANSWSMSVMANWNIFDAGLTNAKVKEAEISAAKASEQDKQLKSSIELEVRQAYLSMKEAEQRIETTQVAVDKASEDLKIAQTKYYAGAGTNMDVMDAQLALTQAKTNYNQALYDYAANKAKLEKASGSPIQ